MIEKKMEGTIVYWDVNRALSVTPLDLSNRHPY